jgi:hypothetical protein
MFPEALITIFPPLEIAFAPSVTLVPLTRRSPAIDMLPFELRLTASPVEVIVKDLDMLVEVTGLETAIPPAL